LVIVESHQLQEERNFSNPPIEQAMADSWDNMLTIPMRIGLDETEWDTTLSLLDSKSKVFIK
jgi:hypothetical protein